MKFLPLVWRNLMRRKIRTFMTVMSIVVAFVLFGALMAIRAAFSMGVDVAGADRLMMIHKVSIIQSLPRSYEERIRATEGVTQVTHANWFGGYYQEPTNFVQSMAVDPESWLQMYPEFEVPADQKKAWLADRTGAVIGADLAKQYGWKVGDRVPLLAPIYRARTRAPWEFTIDGIYDSAKQGVDKTQFFFHFDYLNEAMRKLPGLGDQVGWYIFRVADPSTSDQLAKKNRRDVRQLADGNEDGDGKGVHLRLGQTGRRHRQHHDGDHRRRHVLHPLRRRQRHGAIGSRAHQRAGRAQDARLRRRPDPRRWCCSSPAPSRSWAAGSGCCIGWAIITIGGDPTGGMLPIFHFPPRDLILGADPRARARHRHRPAAGVSGEPAEDRRRAAENLDWRLRPLDRTFT